MYSEIDTNKKNNNNNLGVGNIAVEKPKAFAYVCIGVYASFQIFF